MKEALSGRICLMRTVQQEMARKQREESGTEHGGLSNQPMGQVMLPSHI